jgi:hypothetical protein
VGVGTGVQVGVGCVGSVGSVGTVGAAGAAVWVGSANTAASDGTNVGSDDVSFFLPQPISETKATQTSNHFQVLNSCSFPKEAKSLARFMLSRTRQLYYTVRFPQPFERAAISHIVIHNI